MKFLIESGFRVEVSAATRRPTHAGAVSHCRMTQAVLASSGRPSRRMLALGGIVGPVGFVAAWAAGAVRSDDLSPVRDAISRLAAVGAQTRPLMSTGFVAFGVGVPIYAAALRQVVPGPAWITATVTGLATTGVALAPLDHSSAVDSLHAAFAVLGYVTLAATPLLAYRPLMRSGHLLLARVGAIAGTVAGTSLLLSSVGDLGGLFQRLGLTAGDVWIVASAVAILSGRLTAPITSS